MADDGAAHVCHRATCCNCEAYCRHDSDVFLYLDHRCAVADGARERLAEARQNVERVLSIRQERGSYAANPSDADIRALLAASAPVPDAPTAADDETLRDAAHRAAWVAIPGRDETRTFPEPPRDEPFAWWEVTCAINVALTSVSAPVPDDARSNADADPLDVPADDPRPVGDDAPMPEDVREAAEREFFAVDGHEQLRRAVAYEAAYRAGLAAPRPVGADRERIASALAAVTEAIAYYEETHPKGERCFTEALEALPVLSAALGVKA